MDEVLIICAWPNQTNCAKNLTYVIIHWLLLSRVVIHIWCVAAILEHIICFVVNCKSSCAISTMLVCMARAKVITPYSNNFLSCSFPKVLVYRYLYECYLCFVLLCIFMEMVQCYEVDFCMSVCLFGVVAHTLWLCGKCYCG